MVTIFQWLLTAGPLVLLAGFVAMIGYYLVWRMAPEPKSHPSLGLYILGCAGVGLAAFIIGTFIGVMAACSSGETGNLCGLMGFLGSGPLLTGIAVFVFAHLWARNARRTPGPGA